MKDVLTSRVGRLNGLITLWLARIATVCAGADRRRHACAT